MGDLSHFGPPPGKSLKKREIYRLGRKVAKKLIYNRAISKRRKPG
jgi:hypothetical protein